MAGGVACRAQQRPHAPATLDGARKLGHRAGGFTGGLDRAGDGIEAERGAG